MDNYATKTEIDEFKHALERNAPAFRVELSPEITRGLCDYYQLVVAWNPRLHLVAPCPPQEFAKRHVLESLMTLPYLKKSAQIADIGSGAGLPIIPSLIARPDIAALLIESSQKKTVFLREALRKAGKADSSRVIPMRFENVPTPAVDAVSCRALDRFEDKLSTIADWAPRPSTLLFFGSERMREMIKGLSLVFEETKIPLSDKRFLFVIDRP